MNIVYVGDAQDVIRRILTNHCAGNVEGSVLRRYVAEAMGYTLSYTLRLSGSKRIRINLPDPRRGEREISDYVCSGMWRYLVCQSKKEAHDLQWYTIAQLNPLLNRDIQPWDRGGRLRYQKLLKSLQRAELLAWHELQRRQSGPGVYVLYHQQLPVTKRM